MMQARKELEKTREHKEESDSTEVHQLKAKDSEDVPKDEHTAILTSPTSPNEYQVGKKTISRTGDEIPCCVMCYKDISCCLL